MERLDNAWHGLSRRTVSLRSADGSEIVELGAVPALGIGLTGLLVAPRLTTLLAIAAMLRGVSLRVEDPAVS